jgi:hypothetical protein
VGASPMSGEAASDGGAGGGVSKIFNFFGSL